MRVDLYTNPHIEQREWLFTFSIQTSKVDFADKKLFEKLYSDFNELIADLHQHVRAEEAFVHPLFLAKAPSLADPLHDDHEILELTLQQLCQQMKTIHNEAHKDKRVEVGFSFYRGFNRFISEYLAHIDEEERMLPFLWNTYTDEELALCRTAYKASIGGDEALKAIITEFPRQDQEAQQRLFLGFKHNATQERFLKFSSLLQNELGSNKFVALKVVD